MESSTTQVREQDRENANNRPLPARNLHNIVLAMVGVFFLMAATIPVAMYRVTLQGEGWGEKEKVKGIYLKTLDDAKKPTTQPIIFQSTEKK
jgi:hypothetical protein